MPFAETDRRPFSENNISSLDPNQSGCYGIFNNTQCIYIGQAHDLKERLLQHVNRKSDQSTCIWQNNPTYWLGTLVNIGNLDQKEKSLISEYNPICN
jgi:excinuclease UvrABC nuclease subunit